MFKVHRKQIFIPSVLKFSEGELNNTGKHLKNNLLENVAIFFSDEIEKFFGKTIYESFKSSGIKILQKTIVTDINIENIIPTAFKIPKGVNVIIGFGGGKAIDYGKFCAHMLSLPFISIPTSISNDGFCSSNTSLLVEGKRKSIITTIPYGVIVDMNILKESPLSSIYSGIGDLIAKITASHDWINAAEINGEQFSDFANIIINDSVSDILYFKSSDVRNLEFLYHLAYSLLMSGISMEIANSSRPASGSEHLISHAYDHISKTPSSHGLQVGAATYICSYLQNNRHETVKNFLEITGFFDFLAKEPLNKTDFLQAIQLAPSFKEDFYTILSNNWAFEKAVDFIENDPFCQKILK